MSFNVGDRVRVREGAQYGITTPGSIGWVVEPNPHTRPSYRVYVKFETYGDGTPGDTTRFDLDPEDLELYAEDAVNQTPTAGEMQSGVMCVESGDTIVSIAPPTFNIGDRVVVVDGSHYAVTVTGSIGVVVRTDAGLGTLVQFESYPNGDLRQVGREYWIEAHHLARALPRVFQVGDQVLIVRKVTERTPDWDNCWVAGMDGVVGDGTVRTVTIVSSTGVRTDAGFWRFPPSSLELVQAADGTPATNTTIPRSTTNVARGMEMLAEKLDTAEKVVEMLAFFGQRKVVTDETFADIRDGVRFDKGHFKRIGFPALTSAPQDKGVHIAKCGTLVAYAQSEEKRRADVWTQIKLGRFLTKFHPELDNEVIKAAVNDFDYEHGPAPTVKFGETEEDFIHAIADGPSESCMAHAFYSSNGGKFPFAGHIHPAAVYAAGDIKVAWIQSGDRVTARTLINKETKAFSRVYGDAAKLVPQLEALGYESKTGALAGCRLQKIENEHGNGHIMAYVDAGIGSGGGSLRFTDEGGGYWMLNDSEDGHNTYCGYENRGITTSDGEADDDEEGDSACCDRCGDSTDEDDLRYVECDNYSVCPYCLDRHYTYALVDTRGNFEYVRDEDVTWVGCLDESVHNEILGGLDIVMDSHRGEWVCLGDAVRCVDDEYYHIDDCIAAGENSDGELFIHESQVKDEKKAGHLYEKDGELFWHESDEVVDWKDTVGDEGHDPDEYVVCVAEPEAVKEVSEKIVVALAARMADAVDAEVVATLKTWRDAYKKMQSRGIAFKNGTLSSEQWQFDDPKYLYTIDTDQTFPDDWRAIFLEAQASGVKFEVRMDGSQFWSRGPLMMDGTVTNYRIQLETEEVTA